MCTFREEHLYCGNRMRNFGKIRTHQPTKTMIILLSVDHPYFLSQLFHPLRSILVYTHSYTFNCWNLHVHQYWNTFHYSRIALINNCKLRCQLCDGLVSLETSFVKVIIEANFAPQPTFFPDPPPRPWASVFQFRTLKIQTLFVSTPRKQLE